MVAFSQSQAPNPEELIANLREVEQLTSASPEAMLEWEDTTRIDIDTKAGRLYMSTVGQIQRLQLEGTVINRILAASAGDTFFREFAAIAHGLSLNMQQVLLRGMVKLSGQPIVLDAKEKIVGMKAVWLQARLVREALEREITNSQK